jgi:hypothetical protein
LQEPKTIVIHDKSISKNVANAPKETLTFTTLGKVSGL